MFKLLSLIIRIPLFFLKTFVQLIRLPFSLSFSGPSSSRQRPRLSYRPARNLRFDVRGQQVHLSVAPNGTYVIEMDWVNRTDRLEIQPKKYCPNGIRRQGMSQVATSDPVMNRFWVYSSMDSGFVNQMFDRQTRNGLLDIADFYGSFEFQVLINSGKFVVKKIINQELGQRTADLVRLVIILRNFLINARHDGVKSQVAPLTADEISFVESMDANHEKEVETICLICGQDLDAELVECESCKTLHHKECWEYNGLCATFGCRQDKYHVIN